jgi:predicted MPP superfamily phosphohydrolase
VELSDTTREDRLGPFYQVYVDFILRRVVHDLGNSVSGINSLSDYHLRSGINDPALQESLTLIRESAEQSRDLLVAVGDLLQPADAEEEVVHVQTLIEEAGKFVTLLLPRSIKLDTSGTEQPDALISLLRGDFLRKILALIAMDLNDLRIPTGTIQLGWIRDEKNAWIHYRSNLRSGSALREQAQALLANLSRRTAVDACIDAEAFVVTMTFPLVELAEE